MTLGHDTADGRHRMRAALLAAAALGLAASPLAAQTPPGPPVEAAETNTVQAPVAPALGPALFYVAGIAPDRRPEGAPRIVALRKSPGWYASALHGVSQPYPPSLRFIDDLGAWHSFFANPGMTGPYDIRGWHAAD